MEQEEQEDREEQEEQEDGEDYLMAISEGSMSRATPSLSAASKASLQFSWGAGVMHCKWCVWCIIHCRGCLVYGACCLVYGACCLVYGVCCPP